MIKSRTLRTFSKLLAKQDWKGILAALHWRIPRRVFTTRELYIYESGTKAVEAAVPAGIDFRLADASEIAKIVLFGIEERVVRERFRRGDRCFVASKGDDIVYISWMHQGPCYIKEFGYYLQCSAQDWYLYGVQTHPHARDQGIYSAALYLILTRLLHDSQATITQFVGPHNKIVTKTLPKLGYKCIGGFHYRSILWINITTIYDAVRGIKKRSVFLLPPYGVPEVS